MKPLALDADGDPLPPFARDGATVFAAGCGLTALDLSTGAVRWSTNDPRAGYVRVLPHPDGDRLVTAGLDVVRIVVAAGHPRGGAARRRQRAVRRTERRSGRGDSCSAHLRRLMHARPLLVIALALSACRRATPRPSPRPSAPLDVSIARHDAPPSARDARADEPAAPAPIVVSPAAPGYVLTRRSEELNVVAFNDRALVVDNWRIHEDPMRCEREPESCVGDYAAGEGNPRVAAWVVGESFPDSVRAFGPATYPHSSSSAAGPSTFQDFGAGLVRNARFETVVFGTEYMGEDSYVTLGLDDGSRVGRVLIDAAGGWVDGTLQLAYGTFAAGGNLAVAMGVISLDLSSPYPEAEEPRRGVLRGYVHAGGRFRVEDLASFSGPERVEAPDLALRDDRGAVVFRVGHELRGLRLDGRGRRVGAPVTLSRDRPGAPSIAWDRDTLVVVWARRTTRAQPYRLQMLRWDPTAREVPAPTELATGEPPALAPSIDIRDGRYAIAWMEGDQRTGAVRAGISSESLQDAARRAVTLSTPGANARDPKLALGERVAWVAWQDFGPPAPSSRVAPYAWAYVVTLR